MTENAALLLPILFPVLAGLVVFGLHRPKSREIYVSAVLVLGALSAFWLCFQPDSHFTIWQLTDNISLALRIDGFGRFFVCLTSVIWVLVGVYAFEYIRHEGRDERFFAFYVMTFGVLMGVGFAGNLITLYLFYEFMTLITVPLVIHTGTKEAVAAGMKYLGYSVFGAGLALLGFFFLSPSLKTMDFVPGGVLDPAKTAGREPLLLVVFLLIMVGFGCKAGMMPLQAWLPTAHPVAPAPASGVLSGIITKAGVLAIVRVTYYIYGADFIRGTWVQYTMLTLTLCTVFAGSMLAYKEKLLKKRLAWSSVSQVSYVLFGLMLLTPAGFLGALLQIVFHAVAKNILFLCAGAIIYKTHKTYTYELAGMGKKMPVVMWCFALASLSLIGIPPTAGFVSKWYLAMGALTPELGAWGVVGAAVLLVSALLTAGYLLPVVAEGFFPGKDFDFAKLKKSEPGPGMTVPLILLAAAAVLLGMFPGPLSAFIQSLCGSLL
ncbi:MAG: proton-conducting transporter membrane subunit [Oscillospiraceae bacterium]|nr:proton-conducting transporter membrane subunit [Oscillospiraceae bacterium]